MIPEIKTFILAMTPVGELRLSIPIALTLYNMDPWIAYLLSVTGNIFSVFLILNFLGVVSSWLSSHFRFFDNFFNSLFAKTRDDHAGKIRKYGFYALAFFTAIPLPITGGWTASLIAFVFDLPIKKSFLSISVGVLIAGIIVLIVSQAGIAIDSFLGWQILLGIALTLIIGYLLYKRRCRI